MQAILKMYISLDVFCVHVHIYFPNKLQQLNCFTWIIFLKIMFHLGLMIDKHYLNFFRQTNIILYSNTHTKSPKWKQYL